MQTYVYVLFKLEIAWQKMLIPFDTKIHKDTHMHHHHKKKNERKMESDCDSVSLFICFIKRNVKV